MFARIWIFTDEVAGNFLFVKQLIILFQKSLCRLYSVLVAASDRFYQGFCS